SRHVGCATSSSPMFRTTTARTLLPLQKSTSLTTPATAARPALPTAPTASWRSSIADHPGRPAPDASAPVPRSIGKVRSPPPTATGSAVLPGQAQFSSVESDRRHYFGSVAHIGQQAAAGRVADHGRDQVDEGPQGVPA